MMTVFDPFTAAGRLTPWPGANRSPSVVHVGALDANVPLLPFPLWSASVVPDPSRKFYYAVTLLDSGTPAPRPVEPLPDGATHVPSSRRKRVVPAVAPG